ncbi:DUF883 family protein [Acetobacter oeni]|uniref:DUF883 domain-containing protein n=1 Tax=Acetobacter oeni TaxID=304077 RepID=A0A511XI56_9PROT|nr:DUF883 family protein [Acetobacter oeni]MBB3883048.1 ElaB/YqjD/DUF883 family membrane-anchored ribosome-binding protein [Acetobacter oeni]NHO19124.1 DUF883 family protein [Acetobacter oeni]GBR11557.1 hypothetical protein AA21952_3389 [Acetobacter oeni LMG 21952]GEN62632.1 hypothetical protein AOE01nite_08560 [Acetobacter oeni]
MSAEKIRKNAEQTVSEATSTAREELESLKSQLEQFLNHHVVPTLSEAANTAVSSARDIAGHQKKSVETNVSAKPLLSIGISAVVGFVLGRLSR